MSVAHIDPDQMLTGLAGQSRRVGFIMLRAHVNTVL